MNKNEHTKDAMNYLFALAVGCNAKQEYTRCPKDYYNSIEKYIIELEKKCNAYDKYYQILMNRGK